LHSFRPADDTSTDILEDFLADNPTSTTADRLRFRQAENVFQSGDYEGAVREFRQYLRITNNRNLMPDAYFNMADAYQRTDQKQQAAKPMKHLSMISRFRTCCSHLLSWAESSMNLGIIMNHCGGLNSFLKKIQPFRAGSLSWHGRCKSCASEQNSEARQYFERVLSMYEDSGLQI
jgi:tetratricopeptide (TPR) repeat protein